MSMTEYDILLKTVVVGDPAVGKSSLLYRFSDDAWNPTYIATIGVDFKIRTFERNGKVVKLQLWDTAGQERFKTICAAYYRGAHCIVLVYDITNRESFDNIKSWLREVEVNARENVPIILLGNKCDDELRREVSTEEAQAYADRLGIQHVETSAKTADNVQTAFMKAVDIALADRVEPLHKKTPAFILRDRVEVKKNTTCFGRIRAMLSF
eukprot:Sspe_Gene.32445::Locus_15904_Transcript_1_1_Confidence_1.000_Length_741::g.32445::m.32445/K07874/RAB1A; Ras-related protein Rab-1A